MPFTKDAVNGIITFDYTITSLRDEVKTRSYYKARLKQNQSGESLIEDLAIDEEDYPIVLTSLQKCSQEILAKLEFLQVVLPVGTVPFLWDPDTTGKVTYVIQLKDTMAPNIEVPVDSIIQSLFIHYALQDWFSTTEQLNDAKEQQEKFAMNLLELGRKLRNRSSMPSLSGAFFQ